MTKRKRRPTIERLEERLCMASPVLAATVTLPNPGNWTPTPVRASPIMADIFNTGRDDMITITTGAQLVAYGVGSNGAIQQVMTYVVPNSIADIKSTPIVVTDPTTGRKDLFAAMGRDERVDGSLEDGRIYGWDLETGVLLPGWANGVSSGVNEQAISGVYGPLTSGDLEGDGIPDIVVTSFSRYVTAFHLNGTMMWQWSNDDSISSGAVIGDIDRSGVPSVIVGGDASNNGYFEAGGWITCLSNTGNEKWRKFIPNETVASDPTLADLNNNGYLDIVIGVGENFAVAGLPGAVQAGNQILALDPFGNFLPGWPYNTDPGETKNAQVLQSLAVADVTGDGQLDVIAIDRSGVLHVVQPNGQDLPGFVGGKEIFPELPQNEIPDDYGSPIVADVNGDGKPDIIVSAGQYMRAFDSSGNFITIGSTLFTDGLYEGIGAAAVVGNMYGGDFNTLAFASWDANQNNRPDFAYFYNLPASTYVAAYPQQRRTVSGDAVVRSPIYDTDYVDAAFAGALGYLPAASVMAPFVAALNDDDLNLSQIANAIETSPLVRQTEAIRTWYNVTGQVPDAASTAVWSTYLGTHTIRQMEIAMVGGAEFAASIGDNASTGVTRLYQIFLGRDPSATEINNWLTTGLDFSGIASAISNSDEAINHLLVTMFTAYFGPNSLVYLRPDSVEAFAADYRQGAREEDMATRILGNNGNYAAGSLVAGYIRDVYRDVLHRQASPAEVATWQSAVYSNSINLGQLPSILFNSPEGRADVVQQEFAALLGRLASPSEAAALSNYSSREALILTIVGSPEFYADAGGNQTGYISAVFRDLAGVQTTPQSLINAYLAEFAAGTPLITLAVNCIQGPTLYDNFQAVTFLQQYLPAEQYGVLRTADLPLNAAGLPINPDPTLLAYVTDELASGMTDEAVISQLLMSPAYVDRITYDKGIWVKLGVRNPPSD